MRGGGVGRHGCHGPGSAWGAPGVLDLGNWGLAILGALGHLILALGTQTSPPPSPLASRCHLLLSVPPLHMSLPLYQPSASPCLLGPSPPLSTFSLSSSLAGWGLVEGTGSPLWAQARHWLHTGPKVCKGHRRRLSKPKLAWVPAVGAGR